MIKIFYPALVLLVFFRAFNVCAVDFPPQFRVYKISFKGVASVSRSKLASTLITQTPPAWKFWQARTVITPSDINDDLLRIKQFYRDHGYYHSQAAVETRKISGPGSADQEQLSSADMKKRDYENDAPDFRLPMYEVTFIVDEGAPVLIGSVDIQLKPDITASDLRLSLTDLVSLKQGQIFVLADYQEAKQVLQNRLGNKGNPKAVIKGRVFVNTRDNTADIVFEIDPGPLCVFGAVSVSGNDGYVNDVILDRAITVREGKEYITGKIEETQRNLYNLDVFRMTLIKPGDLDHDNKSIPIRIEVSPRKRQSLNLGLGYGNEDGLRAKGSWTYRNMFGHGGRFDISAKRSDLISNIQAEFIQPYVFDQNNTIGVKSGYERDTLDSYTNRRLFSGVLLQRRHGKQWTWTAGYNLEFNRPEEINISDPYEFDRISTGKNYFISSLEMGVLRNTSDSELNPTRGSVAGFSFEIAPEILGSEVRFIKPSLDLRKYHPLPKGMVLAGRIRLRTIQKIEGTEGIPIFKRLFVGGSNSVRGYGYQELGSSDPNGNPVGGLSSFEANLEVRFPVYGKLSGVVFLDMGLLDEHSFAYDMGDIRYTCGAGLRYHTVIGPIRLDFGYKLNPPVWKEVGDLSRGNEKVGDRWKLHLSIGQAF